MCLAALVRYQKGLAVKKAELFAWARKGPAPNPPLCKALGDEMLATLKELKLARRKDYWAHPGFLSVFPKFEAWLQLREQYTPEQIAAMAANAKAMGVPCGIARRYIEVMRAFKAAWREIYAIKATDVETSEESAPLPEGDAVAGDAVAGDAVAGDTVAGDTVAGDAVEMASEDVPTPAE